MGKRSQARTQWPRRSRQRPAILTPPAPQRSASTRSRPLSPRLLGASTLALMALAEPPTSPRRRSP
jgi:hypothetical protein